MSTQNKALKRQVAELEAKVAELIQAGGKLAETAMSGMGAQALVEAGNIRISELEASLASADELIIDAKNAYSTAVSRIAELEAENTALKAAAEKKAKKEAKEAAKAAEKAAGEQEPPTT
jgi:chromosome segregation ATPase